MHKKKCVKIYTNSQLALLRSITPALKKKYQLPYEVLEYADKVLRTRKLGKTGFLLIVLEPLQNDIIEMKDIIDYYPHKLKIIGDIADVPLEGEDTWLAKEKEWYLDTWKIKGESSKVYVLYCMTLERLYGTEQKAGK